ncbi:malonyl-CoA:anthocyanidin 5-O-glucoside-6''-O-malonyltransferase-like [Mangifera indica]|uniref:malonyl-CoA:anthocyanidin 5-O-glucoside-6''-O-malonyltransferase-like n=1 Tax=Mangifera indica TaxID=29780 RepID=UPI001CFA468E|nr:malonyl-CoA:anthocyanidin 5-O-glucoside-6''-O-malonyltransferase-like [Mangifera indica]
MASSNTMKIQEVFKVTPFSDSTAEFSPPLTLYDTFWFNFPPVERLYFYQITGLTHHFFNSVILPNLKCSLSRTLLHYLPLAGNLIWPPDAPKPCIYYSPTDGGVSVTVAESTADFNSLSGNGVRAVAELHPLIPQLLTSDDKAALIAIQITLFPNQGFSIGITTHHAMFDGKSSTTFIKSWAYLCKQGKDHEENPSLSPELIPSFDRTIIKDPAGIDLEYINNWFGYTNSRSLKVLPNIIPNSDCVRATFELTREDIQKIRNRVLFMLNKDDEKEEDRAPEQLHLSTFLLTLAYVFVCMVKARRGEDNRSVIFAFTADYRTRLSPLVPLNYVGNCVMPHLCTATARDLTEENGIAFVANKLSAVVKGLERGELEGRKDTLSRVLIALKAMLEGVQGLSVAGSTHFDVYGSDFGWGRPNKVEIVSIDRSGAVALAKSRDRSGGVEIGVALEKQEMEVFRSLFADGLKDNM